MNNAIEFISAYNRIDFALRSQYGGNGSLSFSDLVRRCAQGNKTVGKYEEELLTYARLRNAIVHNSVKEHVIAQPSDEVTSHIIHIADLLTSPPRLEALGEKRIRALSATTLLKDAVILIAQTGYSNLPVYEKGKILGILNNRRLVRALGHALQNGKSSEEFLSLPCSAVVASSDLSDYYKICGRNNTVQEVLDAFEENKKLLAVIVTKTGDINGEIVNILTAADLPDLVNMLEN